MERMKAEGERVHHLYIRLCLYVNRAMYVMLDLLTCWSLDIFVINILQGCNPSKFLN